MLRTQRKGRGVVFGVAVLLVVLVSGACVPASLDDEGRVPQNPPIGANGMAAEGAEIWVADLFGGQLLRFDPASGVISRRFGPSEALTAPDDLVVLADGTLVYTSPTAGVVGRIAPGGLPQVLATVGEGVNPIVVDPAGGAVIVGEAFNETSRIVRVSTSDGAQTVLASGVPAVNSFSIGVDGALYAPSGGVPTSLTEEGGVVRIDLSTGSFAQLQLSFPGEPAKPGFRFPVAAKFGPDGGLYVLQGLDAAIYRVDIATGVTQRYATMPTPFGDNLLWVGSRLFASTFFGQVVEISPTGSATVPLGS